MKKSIINLLLLFVCTIFSLRLMAQQTMAQPYYSEGVIRFYNKTSPVASSPCYTLDLSADINTNWGVTQGINDVVIYQNKLFVSIDAGNNTGGVLVYNYADVYPTKTGGPVAVIKPQTASGLSTAGIVIQPSTGNLFLGTFFDGTNDAGIYTYTASSGYASGTQFASYFNDNSIDAFVADLAFDGSGNLWFTEFHGDQTAAGNFLICYKGVNKNNYYKIINPASATYTAVPLAGGSGPNVYLLSQPEGLAFDASGNLWLGNNNDDYHCNPAGDGTLVKISSSWITGTLFAQAYTSSNTVPGASATVDYIPGSKLGGMLFDGNNLYINDQGQNQGSSYATSGTVWKWNTTTAFNAANFIASGIHTTYPGNGLMALDNAQFSLAGACVQSGLSGEKNILTFTIPTQIGNSVIDTNAGTVSVLMPSGANLTSLTPAITVSPNAGISPLTGVAENFSTPKTYIVTAQDATAKTWTVTVTKQQAATGTAATRAAALGKGMNLSVWLENEYWFNSTTTYPDVTRFTATDIANLKSLCFTSVRLPVIFEGFASPTAPYAFTLSNANVVRGLNYVDSVIKWCAANNMMLVIDNHIADDNGSADQTNYQITDANYTTQAALIAKVWKQIIARYEYTNPDQVIFEIRNEPNTVSDAHLRILYQTVIDTIRKYDHTHTLVVGNTGYYDPIALSQSTPYSDTNVIYTTHIYDGDGFYGFCEQGSGGVTNTDSNSVTPIAFPLSGQVTEINTEFQDIHTWSVNNHVPVWLGEFGCTTLPDVYHNTTSRCNYITAMATAITNAGISWAYWDGYGPDDYVSGFGSPTPLYYGFSIFDRSNTLSSAHLKSCFATALGVGGTCNSSGPLSLSMSSTGATCYDGEGGTATVTATGGTGPYFYNWSNLALTATATNLTAGTYTVTVETNDHSQSATASVTVTQPAQLYANVTASQVSCATNTGNITSAPTGGTPGYSYHWNTGATGTGLNIAAGTYSVTVTDSKSCTATGSGTISPPTSFSVSVLTTNVNCYGQTTGSASASVTGVSGNLTYNWSNTATSQSVTNVLAGTYYVTVTDASGCTNTASGIVSQPATDLTASTTSTLTSCTGTTGTANVTASGGTPGYSYLWSNSSTGTGITQLGVGNYTVTVTDTKSCTATAVASVSSSGNFTLTVTSTNENCYGQSTGTSTATVTGAVGTVTYNWSNAATSSTLNGLSAGTYNVTVQDASGCAKAGSSTVTQPGAVTVTAQATPTDCSSNTGTVTLNASGGTPGYTYAWSNSTTANPVVGLGAGGITATVTDSKSCTATVSATVNLPASFTVSVFGTETTGQNGTATVSINGGVMPYQYSWSNNETGATDTALARGTYTVTVIDANGCSATASVTIVSTDIDEITEMWTVNLYPNPANNNLTIEIDGSTGNVDMGVFDISGRYIYTHVESASEKIAHTINVSPFASGVYIFEVTVGRQVVRKRFIVAH